MKKRVACLLLAAPLLLVTWRVLARDSVGETVEAFVISSTPMAMAYIFSITAMKITAFVIGYLIVRLGHDTLVKGVSGEIDFGFSGTGIDAKLKAASPGTFFVLAGAAIIIWGLFVEKPLDIKMAPTAETAHTAAKENPDDKELTLIAEPLK